MKTYNHKAYLFNRLHRDDYAAERHTSEWRVDLRDQSLCNLKKIAGSRAMLRRWIHQRTLA